MPLESLASPISPQMRDGDATVPMDAQSNGLLGKYAIGPEILWGDIDIGAT